MSALTSDLARLLVRDVEGFEREIALFPDDESVWKVVPGVTNPAGNLALHVAGNLQYFVGGLLGGSGYVRNREHEFSCRSGTRQELVAELRAAAGAVRDVLPTLADGWYDRIFPEQIVAGRNIPAGRFLLHLCAHTAFHLGQAGYLRRALTGDATSSKPVPLAVMCDQPQ